MKNYTILVFVLLIGFFATAQKPHEVKKSTALEGHNESFQTHKNLVWKPKEIAKQEGKDLVRLYKYKNSRIKKALSFTTPRNKAKLT